MALLQGRGGINQQGGHFSGTLLHLQKCIHVRRNKHIGPSAAVAFWGLITIDSGFS